MITTKCGDNGETSLLGGRRVRKDDVRVEAYGTVDELMASLAVVIEYLKPLDADTASLAVSIQGDLFYVMSMLAAQDEETVAKLKNDRDLDLQPLEEAISFFEKHLPQFRCFVAPGGSMGAAHCHLSRTICRRAERRVVTLASQEWVDRRIVPYLNRLSDYLFLLARYIVVLQGGEETCL